MLSWALLGSYEWKNCTAFQRTSSGQIIPKEEKISFFSQIREILWVLGVGSEALFITEDGIGPFPPSGGNKIKTN